MIKHLFTLMIGLLLLAGCAPLDVDQEFGKASMSSWDMQIANPHPKNAEKSPEGLAGIDAEKVMDARNKTFGEGQSDAGSLEVGTTIKTK